MKFSKAQLEALGPSRATRDQQFQYLLNLSNRFQTIAGLALMAHYSGDEVFDSNNSNSSLKLATAVVNRNTTFSEDISLRGHTMAFENDSNEHPQKSTPFPLQQQNSNAPTNFANVPASAPKTSLPPPNTKPLKDMTDVMDSSKRIRYRGDHEELDDILFPETMIPVPKPNGWIKSWLESVYKVNNCY